MSIPQPISVGSRAENPAAAILAAKRQQPFAEDGSGEVYFRSDYHHRLVAAAILDWLAKGHHLLLANGDPAADGELLERALNDEGGKHYRATLLRSSATMDFGALVRSCNRRLGLRQEAGSDGLWALLSYLMAEVRKGVRRILVLEDAETLDAACFDELLRFARLDEPYVLPVVLLAGPALAERLAAGELAFLRPAITARIAVDRLAREEVGAFIRCQLNALAIDEEALFSAEAVEGIAAAAGGDPATVNRLARDLLAAARSEDLAAAPVAAELAPPEMVAVEEEGPDSAVEAAAPLLLTEPLAAAAEPSPEESVLHDPPPLAPPHEGRVRTRVAAAAARLRARQLRLASPVAIGLYVLAAAGSGFGVVHWFEPHAAQAPAVALTSPAVVAAHAPPVPRAAVPKQPSALAPVPAMAAAAPAAEAIEPAAGPVVPAAPKPDSTPVAAPALPNEKPAVPAAKPIVEAALPNEKPAAPATKPVAEAALPNEKPAAPAAKPVVEAPLPNEKPAAPEAKPALEAALPNETPAATHAIIMAPPAKPAAAPDHQTLVMVERGGALLMSGDIVSARSFFARAAAAGDADAEFGLAKSYDPLFLRQIGVRGMGGDAATALRWYRRAAADGSHAAAAELRQIGAAASTQSTPEER